MYLMLLFALFSLPAAAAAQPPGSGPTTTPQRRSDKLPPQTFSSPRELLALYGIDASQWEALEDRRALQGEEHRMLIRILFRLPRISPGQMQRWTSPDLPLTDLLETPQTYHGEAFQLQGRVKGIETVPVPADVREGVQFAKYFLVHLEQEAGPPVRIYARKTPSAWQTGQLVDEPAEAQAVFLKRGGAGQDGPLIFAAERIAWLPERPRPENGVLEDHVYLAGLGMDIGLFDLLRKANRQPLSAQQRECFYQLLAALGRADPAKLGRLAKKEIPVGTLLTEPRPHQGRVMTIQGTARRVTRVLVDDREIQDRFGLDHYFQIDMFVPLKDQILQFRNPESPEDSPAFTSTYPVTVCVRQLPPGLPQGEGLRQEVRIAGVFFKLWSYRSQYVSSIDPQQRQLSPMFLAQRPAVVRSRSGSRVGTGLAVGVGFLLALAAIWFVVWRFNLEDAKFASRVLRQRRSLSPGQSLDEIAPPPDDED